MGAAMALITASEALWISSKRSPKGSVRGCGMVPSYVSKEFGGSLSPVGGYTRSLPTYRRQVRDSPGTVGISTSQRIFSIIHLVHCRLCWTCVILRAYA